MLRRLFPLLILLATACTAAPAPVYVYVTPGAIGPAELQRFSDNATNTAIAVGTQSAYATATRQADEQRATAARQATLDALGAQQTAAALQGTQAAVLALSTDAAARRTESAQQTSAWATPTWAALRTQAAAERSGISASATAIAVASDRSQAGADAYKNLWGAAVAIAVLAMLVLAGIGVYWANERLKARQASLEAVEAERVDQARLATERDQVALARMKLELMRDLMIERDGRPWLLMDDGRLAPMMPGDLTPVSHPNQARGWRWRAAIKKTVYCGIAVGAEKSSPQFGERDLAGDAPEQRWVINVDGTPSSTGYRKVARILRKMGIWITSGRDTTFAPDWDAERFEREFDHLPLPELPEGEPPVVKIPDRSPAVPAIAAVSTVPQTEE